MKAFYIIVSVFAVLSLFIVAIDKPILSRFRRKDREIPTEKENEPNLAFCEACVDNLQNGEE